MRLPTRVAEQILDWNPVLTLNPTADNSRLFSTGQTKTSVGRENTRLYPRGGVPYARIKGFTDCLSDGL